MSVLLNPQQMIIIHPPIPCIFLLLILLFALNFFPQLLLLLSSYFWIAASDPSLCSPHASLWYPFKSSGPLLPARDVNDICHPGDVASHFNSLFLGNTTIILPRNWWGFLNNLAHLRHFSDSLSWHVLPDQHWPCSTQPVTNSGCCCKH